MSIDLMSKIWRHFPSAGGELNCALALADHAKDDGSSIYPSVAELARKTRQSARTVQRQLRQFEAWGWLECVGNESGGRDKPREYRIATAYVDNPGSFTFGKGDKMSPFPDHKRVTPEVVKGDTAVSQKGDTAVSPESSVTIMNHHPPVAPQGLFSLSEGEVRSWFDRVLWPKYPKRVAKRGAVLELLKLKPDASLLDAIASGLDRAIAAARTSQAKGEFVPEWPYLERWLRKHRWTDELSNVPRETTTSSSFKCVTCGAAAVVSKGGKWFCRADRPAV